MNIGAISIHDSQVTPKKAVADGVIWREGGPVYAVSWPEQPIRFHEIHSAANQRPDAIFKA